MGKFWFSFFQVGEWRSDSGIVLTKVKFPQKSFSKRVAASNVTRIVLSVLVSIQIP